MKELFAEKLGKYWPGLVELGKAAGKNVGPLFRHGLPVVKELFAEKLDEYWPELVELGKAAGKDAAGKDAETLFQYSLPAVKGLITDQDSLKTVGNQLGELGKVAGKNAWYLFAYGLPVVKKLFAEKLGEYWPGLVELGKTAGENARYLFAYGLPAVKELITDQDSLKTAGDQLVELGRAAGENFGTLFQYGLPAVKELITDQASLQAVGNQLVELGKAAGENTRVLFRDGLPAVKALFAEKLDEYWPELVELGKAAGKDAETLFQYGLPVVKELITDQASLKTAGNQLVELGKAAGEEAEYLFKNGLPAVKGLFAEKLGEYWPQLVELGKAAGKNAGHLFQYGLPAVKHEVEDFIQEFDSVWHPLLTRLVKSVTDHNGERVFKLIFEESKILEWVSQHEGDHAKHFEFYVELLEENRRLGYQILEGLFESLKMGKVSVEIEEERSQIKSFVRETNGMNPYLYSFYLEKGDAALEEVKEMAAKALKDDLSPQDIRAYQQEMDGKGYQGKELALAAVGMAIPLSGASFVKREEIMGLFEKYLEAGDRREDIPEELRGFVHTGGGYRQVVYVLQPGKVLDPDGAVGAVLSRLRYPDSGKSEEAIQKVKEETREAFVSALKGYLADRKNKGKREAALEGFYKYARHHDLLKEKVDAIQGLDYVSLELLESLFSDKDQLRQLLWEVLEQDIEAGELSRPGEREVNAQDVKGLVKQLNKIWNHPDMSERNKILAFGRILRVYKQEDLKNQLIPVLEGGLQAQVQEIIAGGELTIQVSKKQIGEDLFGPVMDIIRKEKDKYAPQESGEVIEL